MNCSILKLRVFFVLAVMAVLQGVVQAADPPAAAPTLPSAATGSSSGTLTGGTSTDSTSASAVGSSTSTSAARKSAAADQARKNPPVLCFKFTMQCIDSKATPSTPTKRTLNLTPPDIRTVVPDEELKEPLPTIDEQMEAQEGQTVQVQGTPAAPDVPGGFGALWWALNHPSQAWRIFTPAE